MVVLPICAICSVHSIAATGKEEVPISQVYGSIQPPLGTSCFFFFYKKTQVH